MVSGWRGLDDETINLLCSSTHAAHHLRLLVLQQQGAPGLIEQIVPAAAAEGDLGENSGVSSFTVAPNHRLGRRAVRGPPCSVIYPQHQKCDLYHKLPRQNIRHCNLLFPLAPLSCLSVHRSPLGILPFLAVPSVEPENMSTYVIVEEPGDWPCHDRLSADRPHLPATRSAHHRQGQDRTLLMKFEQADRLMI